VLAKAAAKGQQQQAARATPPDLRRWAPEREARAMTAPGWVSTQGTAQLAGQLTAQHWPPGMLRAAAWRPAKQQEPARLQPGQPVPDAREFVTARDQRPGQEHRVRVREQAPTVAVAVLRRV
jgi:hypothetical protein